MRKYIVVILATILIAGCINANDSIHDIEAEEYAVYSAIINERFETFIIVVEDHTVCRSFPGSKLSDTLESIYQDMPAANKEIFDDFLVKNEQSYPLDHCFHIRGKVFLVSREKLRNIFESDYGWLIFYMRYPFSQGIAGVSRVGFNKDMDQALVYFKNSRGSLSGAGYYMLLTKKEGVWYIEDERMIWIS
ncbi:MAG: hypothetical protein PVF58_05830 [Candidatus Methanofastidiosia archaeon]|jgi:hypothetical protein